MTERHKTMITFRKSNERGRTQIDWLDSYHSFSFGQYYDPANMGFGPLRVINDDLIGGGGGFGMHGHRDMEIISYIDRGALQHRDSLGNGSVIRPGEVQYMSAGSGIRHSEFNPSDKETVRLLQIWIEPSAAGLPPRYAQQTFDQEEATQRPVLLLTPDGRDGTMAIRQDATLSVFRPGAGASTKIALTEGRRAWIQVVRGEVQVDGGLLREGDAAAIENAAGYELKGSAAASDVLLFDLP
jgi:hypothetical protein